MQNKKDVVTKANERFCERAKQIAKFENCEALFYPGVVDCELRERGTKERADEIYQCEQACRECEALGYQKHKPKLEFYNTRLKMNDSERIVVGAVKFVKPEDKVWVEMQEDIFRQKSAEYDKKAGRTKSGADFSILISTAMFVVMLFVYQFTNDWYTPWVVGFLTLPLLPTGLMSIWSCFAKPKPGEVKNKRNWVNIVVYDIPCLIWAIVPLVGVLVREYHDSIFWVTLVLVIYLNVIAITRDIILPLVKATAQKAKMAVSSDLKKLETEINELIEKINEKTLTEIKYVD